MFGNLKTKGFNLEDTHPAASADKLSILLAGLGLAVALAVKTGWRRRPIPIKKHGGRAGSLFALGLSASRQIFAAANPPQASPFLSQLLSRPLNSLKYLVH
jgi:hypothetical protein